MSEILVDNLTGKTSAGSITVTSEGGDATQSLQQGLAKVFVVGASNKASVLTSFNCSHLSDDGTGKQSVTFTNPFSTSNYVPATSLNAGGDKTHTHDAKTSSSCQFVSRDASSAALQDLEVSASIHGDLS